MPTQRYGLIINKKKVYRLCKELDILRPQRKKQIRHIRRLARNRTVNKINELWEIDVKYGYIAGEDRFFFILWLCIAYWKTCLSRHDFENYQEAVKLVAEYIDFYTNRRLHSSLRYMPPAKFSAMVAGESESPFVVKV